MFYNLTERQFYYVMRSLGDLFSQNRPTQGPDFGSRFTEMTNRDYIEAILNSRKDRGMLEC